MRRFCFNDCLARIVATQQVTDRLPFIVYNLITLLNSVFFWSFPKIESMYVYMKISSRLCFFWLVKSASFRMGRELQAAGTLSYEFLSLYGKAYSLCSIIINKFMKNSR